MENTNANQPSQSFQAQPPVPNTVAVLVLGILSVVFFLCYGIIGLTLGIIALVLAKKSKALYESNPNAYSQSSYNNLKAGRICAIIGVCLSGFYLLLLIGSMIFLGSLGTIMPWAAEQLNK